jgi:hypothetical protein
MTSEASHDLMNLMEILLAAINNELEVVRVKRRTLITFRSAEKLLLPPLQPAPDAPRRRGRPRKVGA